MAEGRVKSMDFGEGDHTHRRNQMFLDLLLEDPEFNGGPWSWMDHLKRLPKLTHIAIRPAIDEYDIAYWNQNGETVMNKEWVPGQPAHLYRKMTIQQWEASNEADAWAARNDVVVTYQLFDVHYYLGGWKPKWSEEKHSVHAVGGMFHVVPGRYLLPANEGEWYRDGQGFILFKARGSSHDYSHPDVPYQSPTTLVDFGWYKVFYDFCSVTKLHNEQYSLEKALPTGYSTTASV